MNTTTEPRRSCLVALLLTIVVLAAACGDDGDSGAATPSGADVTTPSDDDGGASSGGGETAPDPGGSGDGGALVTLVTGEEFEFDQELVCIGLGGALSGTFRNAEGVEVSIDVPPEDWETSTTGDWDPPSLTLRDERDELNWRIFEAGPDVATTYGPAAEGAVITDFSVEGSRATGNGMAVDTFAISRAGADGSEPPSLVPIIFSFECS